jgi:hypothetical protein
MKNLRSTRSLIASLAAAPIMMAAAWPAMAEAAAAPPSGVMNARRFTA